MSQISLIIPFHSDNGPREKAFRWIIDYYKTILPDAEFIVGSSPAPFNKSSSINRAVKNASGEILIILDADIICSPEAIYTSLHLLDRYTWVIPFKKVLDLTEESSKTLLNSKPQWPLPHNLEVNIRKAGDAIPVGGINIVRKKDFITVGGFDERFKGWGGEDDAFAAAMNTICGRFKRINNNIYHIWHPSSYVKGSDEYRSNFLLASRYCRAHRSKMEMMEIIKERIHPKFE